MTKHDVKVKLCFIYSVLLNTRWSHLSLFQRINSVLMIESVKKVGLYVSFSNPFLKTSIQHFFGRVSQYKLMFVKLPFELRTSCNTTSIQETA